MRFSKDRIIKIVVLVGVVIFLTVFYVGAIEEIKERFNAEYHGVINKIEFRPNHRGFPHVLLDTTWRFFGMDEKNIIHEIQELDSVAKRKGSFKITVYRKKIDGKYYGKEYNIY